MTKPDPYDSSFQKSIDAVLLLLIAAILAYVVSGAHQRQDQSASSHSPASTAHNVANR